MYIKKVKFILRPKLTYIIYTTHATIGPRASYIIYIINGTQSSLYCLSRAQHVIIEGSTPQLYTDNLIWPRIAYVNHMFIQYLPRIYHSLYKDRFYAEIYM